MITLNTETVAAYKELLTNPEAHDLTFKPITECFESCETATAQHILYKQYLAYLNKPLPKIMFYIIMGELYGQPTGLDPTNGCLGFFLRVKPSILSEVIKDLLTKPVF